MSAQVASKSSPRKLKLKFACVKQFMAQTGALKPNITARLVRRQETDDSKTNSMQQLGSQPRCELVTRRMQVLFPEYFIVESALESAPVDRMEKTIVSLKNVKELNLE
jgi:hypothetical protein